MTAAPPPDVPLAECIAWLQAARYLGRANGNSAQEQIADTLLAHLRRLASAPPDAVWMAVPRGHAELFANALEAFADGGDSIAHLMEKERPEIDQENAALREAARRFGEASDG
jgi:hypothetical protein